MNKIAQFLSFGMVTLIISSCHNINEGTVSTAIDTSATTDKMSSNDNNQQDTALTVIQKRYIGTIPCADCEGIKMVLTFVNETYKLEETYLGKSDQPIKSEGIILIERGYEKDNDATLYILNPDSDTDKRYFVRLTAQPGKLIMLDKDQKIIRSQLNYTLSAE
ncbi:copper resistance protein NlpE [Sphingobacterium sp. HMA12]|uniref:copper resistance protein NlpE n=1 Tax=Sphingobacterium sp. HMA12 TaxID=2050894 RepID=UPI000CEA3CEA|nr:copper resistance protein NlpE [Sphingobacterium sp. HMA12]